MVLALDGIKVLDITQVAAAPMAARHLADFGADVIHIEHPVRGDSWRVFGRGAMERRGIPVTNTKYAWECYNRNKKSVAINLSHKAGQEIICQLLKDTDVVVTNLRPFELKKFNLEYESVRRLNPRLIFAQLTGLSNKGPEKDSPGYDSTTYWTRAGIPYLLSRPGMFCAGFRAAIGDNVAAMTLAYGIMTALYAREKTGQGQEVYVSLFQTGVYQMSYDVSHALGTGRDYAEYADKPPQELLDEAEAIGARLLDYYMGNAGMALALPLPYSTKDGRQLSLSMVQSDLYWPKFCAAIGRKDLENDPRFSSAEARGENDNMLYHILKDTFLSKTLEEWKTRLEGIPFGCYQNLNDIIKDPVAREGNFFISYQHPTHGQMEVLASPVNLSETPAAIRMPAPEFGQHTEEVLLECAYTWEDIVRLREQGTIA